MTEQPPLRTITHGEKAAMDLHAFVKTLFPITRSITGNGVRATLGEIAQRIPLVITEVPSGTAVFDWYVPKEWNIKHASIKTVAGRTLVDLAENNLHIVSYSKPFNGIITREELSQHIHTLPDQPDAIPYRTGYYADDWGFCLSHRLWMTMQDESYAIDIESDLSAGSLSYGECFIRGDQDAEILISVHICHPSLANDNLSGVAVATALAMRQAALPRQRFGVRFLFVPATIGAIAWLAQNETGLSKIRHGLVLTCVGDGGPFHYKLSRSGAPIDRIVEHVLRHAQLPFEILPFAPYGYDERQYASPTIDLPVGCLMRGVHGAFPEYHTSLDNCDFVTSEALDQSFHIAVSVLDTLESDRVYVRTDGRGEPQLGRRGLYRAIAGQKDAGGPSQMDLLWLLNLADGRHSLLDIAERAGAPFSRIKAAARLALDADLVRETDA